MSEKYQSETFNDELVLAVTEAVEQIGWSVQAMDVQAHIADHFRMLYTDRHVLKALKAAWQAELIEGFCANGTRWYFWAKTAFWAVRDTAK